MRFQLNFALILCAACCSSHAQWQMQDAHTLADLRGIDSVGNGVAWASGTNGTVLRTEDSGFVWQLCALPPGAEHLDFRGIQAFDNNTAIVMSSGKGDLSRLYKTTDGCQTWKLLFTNPDQDGFWDALRFQAEPNRIRSEKPTLAGVLLGDPVNGHFVEFESQDGGEHWAKQVPGQAGTAEARGGEAIFAASNSSLILGQGGAELFVTGGPRGARSVALSEYTKHASRVSWTYVGGAIPLSSGDSAGAFSIAAGGTNPAAPKETNPERWTILHAPEGSLVAVGGDYRKPGEAEGTAAWSQDSGLHWTAAASPPHGYRSSVAYDAARKLWISVGPNGTDVSLDDGRTWRALRPRSEGGDAADADQHWNALSLPFVVGPHGRIATLRPDALPQTR